MTEQLAELNPVRVVVPAQRRQRRTRREPQQLTPLGMAVLLLGAFLPMLDFFIVNVALPTIDATLHGSPPDAGAGRRRLRHRVRRLARGRRPAR